MKSQIQFETNGLMVLVVPVPETSKLLHIKSNSKGLYLQGAVKNENNHHSGYTSEYLPEGNWKFHCATDAMTEEQAKVLAERCDDGLFIQGEAYTNHQDDEAFYSTAIESLESKIECYGINPNEKHVILIEEV